MTLCSCGIEAEPGGAFCARCEALQVLGLTPEATPRDIEATYRMLVKVWHPDRFGSDAKLKVAAEEKLKSINAAHAALTSAAGNRTPRRRRPAPPDPAPQPAPQAAAKVSGPPGPRGRRSLLEPILAATLLVRFGMLVAGLAIGALLVSVGDSALSNDPAIGSFYRTYRNQIVSGVKTQTASMWDRVTSGFHRAPAGPPAAPVGDPAAAVPEAALPRPPRIPMPYVTAGFTRNEVIATLGEPVASTPESLSYSRGVFYLHDGRVTGWRVDRSWVPFKVKLLPEGHVDPHLRTFELGSTRDEVLAVQGTPTLVTRDKFAYGTSEVFFENGRVIGWMNDHASEQLRTSAR